MENKKLTKDQISVILKNAPKNLSKTVILDQYVLDGYELEGVDNTIARQNAEKRKTNVAIPIETQDQSQKTTLKDRVKGVFQDIKQVGTDVAESSMKRSQNIGEIRGALENGQQSDVRSILQTAGQLAGAGADAITATGKGLVNVFLNEKQEKDLTSWMQENIGEKVMSVPIVQKAIAKYQSLPPEQQRDVQAIAGVLDLASNFVGGGAVSKTTDVAGTGISSTVKGIKNAGVVATDAIIDTTESVAKSGAGQIITDIADRVPRAIKRGQENLAEAGVRAEKIKMATPEVATAIKSNLDDRIINTVTQADNETKKAFKQVLDIADETPKTIGVKKQPSLVGGDLAVKQYDLINKQKKTVGEKIGEITKNLSKTQKVNMGDSFNQMDEILAGQGIVPTYSKKGIDLNFSGSRYTPAERTKIKQLYDLALEGGDNLTPSQIKSKDQLFSKLKRESNFEGIGDLIIETPEGNKSLFNVFRDIYSNKLDTISPEVRKLNASYRSLSNLTDDIEDSIFKTPNFNVTKSVDPAEFAKVNMRRIFGEAQSSPVFEAVADVMDKASRGLGYKGATPKQVAEFAEYIRKLYPESVPKTGFQGGIKAGISDVIETVSKMGAPNVADQRKALRDLLEKLPKNKKK